MRKQFSVGLFLLTIVSVYPTSQIQLHELLQKKISLGQLTNRFLCKRPQLRNEALDKVFTTGEYKGFTPLTLALQLNRTYTVKLLIKYGVDLNKEDGFGTLPLEFAIDRAWLETIRLLLENGAALTPKLCVNLPNRMPIFYHLLRYQCFDKRCLDWMLLGARNHYDIILLLKQGAYIHYKNEYGTTAIDNAIRRCDSRSLKILYSYGANLADIKEDTLRFLDSECMTSRCNLGIDGERRCQKTRDFLKMHGI
ncbi:MAG TPA: ankyrin repeat domain-containing protein [Candidatus Babeliales bacterium]|nr:ankyrin repeat domain-containing protein [Candidatus Babeliales bacterium]